MTTKVTRRKFIKRTVGTILTTIGVSSGGYFYAKNIEPNTLSISNILFEHPLIPSQFDGLTIVQFSDTHLGFQYSLKQLKELIYKINLLKPDLIFFTGDLIDEPNTFAAVNETIELLQQLSAPLGKYAVFGNHDHGGYGTKLYKQIMDQSGFELLFNQAKKITSENNSELFIVGIDDAMLGQPNIAYALEQVPLDSFKILLSHAPDLADEAQSLGIHLQLSGHSHGGQIKIPFLGALVKPPFAEKYYEGTYKIGLDNQLTLHVNRGLGTTRLPFRFLARPELTIITLSQI